MRIGVVNWNEIDSIRAYIMATLEKLGCEVVDLPFDAKLPDNLDVVLMYGPYDSVVPLGKQLAALPAARRPQLVMLHVEQFPSPKLPEWLQYTVGTARSMLERAAYYKDETGAWKIRPYMKWITTRAFRFRYYGDIHWLRRQGVLSFLGISSFWTADYLRKRSFEVLTLKGLGFPDDPVWGTDLKLERDIPVLWIGKIATQRRRDILNRVRAGLRARGVEMMFIDGEENPYVFDEERTKLFNRTKVALNIVRQPWDDNSMRYYLAALNRTLVVTEPTLKHTSFEAGKHVAEAPIDQIVDKICYYLEHDEERKAITEAAYELVTEEATWENALQDMLNKVRIMRTTRKTVEIAKAPHIKHSLVNLLKPLFMRLT